MTQKHQTKTNFYCEFNKGCGSLCSLCPNQNPQKEVVLVALTEKQILALLYTNLDPEGSKMDYADAIEILDEAYENLAKKK